jgi:hypothetical protein
MSMVQCTPDGKMVVRSGTKVYIDTEANFATDFGEPHPTMPAGATDCVYEPGVRHTYTNGVTIIAGGPVPWTAGDRYIANIDAALASQATRPPPVTPATPGGLSAQLNPKDGPNDGGSSPRP